MTENRDVDRQLLFGILALQNNFIDRSTLVEGLRAWVLDRSRPLSKVLGELGAIDESARPLLEALVVHQLKLHGDDPGRSLAGLEAAEATCRGIESIDDPDLRQSLSFLVSGRTTDPEDDPYATRNEPIPAGLMVPPVSPSLFEVEVGRSTSRGRFRVLHPHAKGGLGQVSVAMDEELGRQVALKEIQDHHADNPEYRSRFIREAEVTGKLEHPGIIPVYGLGQDESGRPFYAMRFIRGDNLDAAIARHHRAAEVGEESPGAGALRLRELLGRFLDVCNAMAYAHSRRVIHRDLKPGNILLGPFGETLVVDWGLAKPLDDPDDATSTLGPIQAILGGSGSNPTMAGVAHGTPAYMSPEQAEGRLDRIGPASDVYSLGATLYHILTGRPAFGGSDAVARVSIGDFPPPRKVLEGVPRALEAICLKAMAREPGARYPTPGALAADLKRWLADEPVSAHREPITARGRRWMKRHRTAMSAGSAAAMVAMVGLGLFSLVTTSKNLELKKANRIVVDALARSEADRNHATMAQAQALKSAQAEALARVVAQSASAKAEVEARTAGRTTRFLIGMLVTPDPIDIGGLALRSSKQIGRNLTAVEILDRGSRKITTELKDEPLVQATLMATIGDVYRSLVQFEKAEPLLRKALEIRRAHLAEDDLAVAESLHQVGWLYQARGRFAEALESYRQALEIRRAKLGERSPAVADTMFQIAWILAEDWNPEEAEPLFRQVIASREATPGAERELAIAQLGLSAVLIDTQRNLEALPLIAKALMALRGEQGMDHMLRALVLFQQGIILGNQGFFKMAEPSFRKALEIANEVVKDDHPYTGMILFSLAFTLEQQGRIEEADALYRKCLEIARNTVGLGYPRVLVGIQVYGQLLSRTGRGSEADALFAEMVAARRLTYPPGHKAIAEALVLEGRQILQSNPAKAEQTLREGLQSLRQGRGRPSIRMLEADFGLAELLGSRGDREEAEVLLREGLRMIPTFPPGALSDPPDFRGVTLSRLGKLLAQQGKFAEAETTLAEAIRIYQAEANPRNRPNVTMAMEGLALLRRRQGRPVEAAALTPERRLRSEGKPALLYVVARDLALCIPMVAPEGRPPDPEALALQSTYADQVLDILRQAIRAGFRDVRRLNADLSFQPLKVRQDFRDLADDLGFPDRKPFAR